MNIDYRYMLPKKAESLKTDIVDVPLVELQSLQVETYNEATILPVKYFDDDYYYGRGGVIDKDGKYIENSSLNKRMYGAYKADSCYSDKSVVYCGYFIKHWGHFLVDVVNRLWYRPDNTDAYVFIVNENQDISIGGNYKRFFELLGISDKIIFINKPTKFKKVEVAQAAYSRNEYFTKEYKKIFDDVVEAALQLNVNLTSCEKIFLSRSNLKKAKNSEINIKEIDKFFKANDFTILHPQDMSLDEMIFYINKSSICAAISGTLPHNMLFAKDKSTLIVVEKNIVNNEFQVDINKIRDLNVTYIDGCVGVLPVDVGTGPFILGFTKLFQKYAIDNNFKTISSKLDNVVCFRFFLKQYVKSYFNYTAAYPPQWITKNCADIVEEAYNYGRANYQFVSLDYIFRGIVGGFIDKIKSKIKI